MTGCRRGEAFGLTWPDLDNENGRVTIGRALVPIDGKLGRDRAQDQTRPAADRAWWRDGGGAPENRPPGSWPSSKRSAMSGSTAGECSPPRNGAALAARAHKRPDRLRGACRGVAPHPPSRAAPYVCQPRLGQGRQSRRSSRGAWDMPPWPSPWTSTLTCCPKSMPKRPRSSRHSRATSVCEPMRHVLRSRNARLGQHVGSDASVSTRHHLLSPLRATISKVSASKRK